MVSKTTKFLQWTQVSPAKIWQTSSRLSMKNQPASRHSSCQKDSLKIQSKAQISKKYTRETLSKSYWTIPKEKFQVNFVIFTLISLLFPRFWQRCMRGSRILQCYQDWHDSRPASKNCEVGS